VDGGHHGDGAFGDRQAGGLGAADLAEDALEGGEIPDLLHVTPCAEPVALRPQQDHPHLGPCRHGPQPGGQVVQVTDREGVGRWMVEHQLEHSVRVQLLDEHVAQYQTPLYGGSDADRPC
jgi:hypothetical protein